MPEATKARENSLKFEITSIVMYYLLFTTPQVANPSELIFIVIMIAIFIASANSNAIHVKNEARLSECKTY